MNAFPDNETLLNYLGKSFSADEPSWKKVEIISRLPAVQNGTFQAEIITFRLNDGSHVSLRCKYLKGLENNQEGGHRGGVIYEAAIYEHLLRFSSLPTAIYYDQFKIVESDTFCLFIQNLEGSVRINQAAKTGALERAAAWIGTFHANFESRHLPFIKTYDNAYYRYWVQNVQQIGQELKTNQPWIDAVCEYFIENINRLTSGPCTIIHGEYYPNNILYKEGLVYPVDWESTAFAPGEIDLASLTEGYTGESSEALIRSYSQARWRHNEGYLSDEGKQRLSMARLYFHLRWLGRYATLAQWKENEKKWVKFNQRLIRL